MKNIRYYFLLILPMIIISCSDNEPTGPGNGPYQPTQAGSYWLLENYTTDSLGNREASTKTSSTMTAGATYSLKGKQATNFIEKNQNGMTDTLIIASEGQVIYFDGAMFNTMMNAFMMFGGGNINIPQSFDWIKIADANSASWDVGSIPISDLAFDFVQGVPMKLNGNIKLTGNKKGTSNFSLNNGNYTAQEYNLDIVFSGKLKAKVLLFDVEIADISFTQKVRTYFVPSVGLVKRVYEPSKLSVKFNEVAKQASEGLEDMEQVNGGTEQQTVSFSIKQ